MSKRKFLVLLSAGLLVACPIAWLFFSLVGGRTDAEKYRSLQRLYNLGFHARCAELSGLGAPLRRFRLADRCYDRFNLQRDELVASGYLTNISIELSNPVGRKVYVFKQLGGIERGSDALVCGIVFSSNSLVITCRPEDAGRFRQALAP
jgi:hypothetical protein